MEEGVIRHTLDLLVNLYDSTTGRTVEEREVRFEKEGKKCPAMYRGEGTYVFLNAGRDNSLMHISVKGFEPVQLDIDYEKLDKILPAVDVFLIPSENSSGGEALITIKGNLTGLVSVEAVHPGRPVTTIRDIDLKRRTMTVFMPNRRMNMTQSRYALLNAEKQTFETIEVETELSDRKIRVKQNPSEEFPANSPVCRIVYGQVEKDGTYLLRVRDDGKNLKYLVKYVVDGQSRYKVIDFHESEGVSLD